MSENDLGSDFGETDYDPQQQKQADLWMDDPEATDNEPWSPPDRQPRAGEFLDEDGRQEETIDQRILQEEPEEGTAYGAPDRQGEYGETDPEMLGGDDPDAIPADEDVLGTEGAEDLDVNTTSPEESAMHVDDAS